MTQTMERTKSSVKVTSPAPLPEPIQYLHRSTGKALKAHIFGDVEGKSPSYLCSDEQGNEDWYSIDELQNVDPQFVSGEQIRSAFTNRVGR